MNKIFKRHVVNVIASTQDGKSLSTTDEFSGFLNELIDKNENADGEMVDVSDLTDNLRYAIQQFKKALSALEEKFPEPEEEKEIMPDAIRVANSIMPFITIGVTRGSESEVRNGIAKAIENLIHKHKNNQANIQNENRSKNK